MSVKFNITVALMCTLTFMGCHSGPRIIEGKEIYIPSEAEKLVYNFGYGYSDWTAIQQDAYDESKFSAQADLQKNHEIWIKGKLDRWTGTLQGEQKRYFETTLQGVISGILRDTDRHKAVPYTRWEKGQEYTQVKMVVRQSKAALAAKLKEQLQKAQDEALRRHLEEAFQELDEEVEKFEEYKRTHPDE